MLKHTFLHIPGVGPVTERRLWERGVLCWDDCLQAEGLSLVRRLEAPLLDSQRALADRDAGYFQELLPPREAWRLYQEFGDSVAFLDIETTGLSPDYCEITVVGVYDGRETRSFVQGINLYEFAHEIQKYDLLVTFNGRRFDIPFLRYTFGNLPPRQGHIDLRYPLRRLGYTGGLKAIERRLGMEREGALKQVDGFMAVLLWQEYRAGNERALETLLRYNLEDVVNLQPLADLVYNLSVAELPIGVERVAEHPRPLVHVPFDAQLIERLSAQRTTLW